MRSIRVFAKKTWVIPIMNHDSGFIIGITVEFLKILIEQSPKTSLRKQTRAQNNTQMAYYQTLNSDKW